MTQIVTKCTKTPVEAFALFFIKKIIKNSVHYTNAVVQVGTERFSDLFEQSNKYPHFWLVDQLDIEEFIRAWYLRAAFRINLNRECIWNHGNSHDVIGSTMSENRFMFISCFISFDDKPTKTDRWKTICL